MQANVILCKCSPKHTFGIRVEKRSNDWVRTWAFKIDEERAKGEGYDGVKLTGTFEPVDNYPGCPYCGGTVGLSFCSCGRINCSSGGSDPVDIDGEIVVERTCNWCGETGYYTAADVLDASAGRD